MGFFSELLQIAAPIVGALVPGLAAPLQVAVAAPAIIAQQTVEAQAAAAARTGAMRKQTLVQTLDASGKVIKQTVTKGGVAVFQQDVTAANRVARQLRRLEKRMPRKLVKQSEQSRLKDEVTNAALRRARDLSDCPPKC